MNDKLARLQLERMEKYLLSKSNWQQVELTRKWAKKFPDEAGVYILFHESKPVYVGETGKISGRMKDMLNTKHHTVRKSVGEEYFSNCEDYEKASSKKSYSERIEKLVEEIICEFSVCAIPVKFGRKEIEEHIMEKFSPKYNHKKKRI